MATIGIIKIASEFSTAGLKKGAAAAVGALNRFKAATSSVSGTVAGLGTVVAGAAGAYGLTSLVKSSIESIDTTSRLASRLGVTTEELSRLQYAAGQARIDVGTLGGMLEGLNTSLVEVARTGSGGAVVALRKLHLNAMDLAKVGPVEALKRITGALGSIPSAAERAATATEIFGASGQSLLALAEKGPEGIAALEAEADALGVTLSGLDTAQVVEAEDAMTKLSAAVGVVGKAIAIELAPFIVEASTYLVDMVKNGVTAGSVVGGAFEIIGNASRGVLAVWDALAAAFNGMQGIVLSGMAKIIRAVGMLAHAIDYVIESLTGLKSGLEQSMQIETNASAFEESAKMKFDAVAKYMAGPSTAEAMTSWIDGIQEAAKTRAQAKVAAKPKAGALELQKIPQIAGAAALGSKEAQTAVAKFRVGINPNDQIKTVAGNTGKANELLLKVVNGIQKIADGAGNGSAPIKALVGI